MDLNNNPQQTSSGIDQNIAAVLTYVLGLITGIVFLLIEKENRFIRFHAMQSIAVSVMLIALSLILNMIPLIGWILSLLISPLTFILWVFLMYKAYKGEWFKLPVVGKFAEDQVK